MCNVGLTPICKHLVDNPNLKYWVEKREPIDSKDIGLIIGCEEYEHNEETVEDWEKGWVMVCLDCIQNRLGIKVDNI